jgi:acyl-CoA reductase-like NAD-dependent aldehyde dehydrogenase
VLLWVEPWNFPLYQVVRFAGPNLVLGNTILLKHAEICPQSALALERLFCDAGVPEGVYTNIFVPIPEIQRIIENQLVQGASLTGSERAGISVGEIAGRNLKKSVLELGGSDPFIVLDGEQLEHTIDAAVAGRMANTGQSCVESKRFIVLDELHRSDHPHRRDARRARLPRRAVRSGRGRLPGTGYRRRRGLKRLGFGNLLDGGGDRRIQLQHDLSAALLLLFRVIDHCVRLDLDGTRCGWTLAWHPAAAGPGSGCGKVLR